VKVQTHLTKSMERNPASNANKLPASQEISRLSWNTKVHYRVHESLPIISTLSQINPIITFTVYSFKTF
jgi:hypothetical protein